MRTVSYTWLTLHRRSLVNGHHDTIVVSLCFNSVSFRPLLHFVSCPALHVCIYKMHFWNYSVCLLNICPFWFIIFVCYWMHHLLTVHYLPLYMSIYKWIVVKMVGGLAEVLRNALCVWWCIVHHRFFFHSSSFSLSLSLSVGVCMSMSKHCLCTQLSELTHKHCNNLHLTVTTIHPWSHAHHMHVTCMSHATRSTWWGRGGRHCYVSDHKDISMIKSDGKEREGTCKWKGKGYTELEQ